MVNDCVFCSIRDGVIPAKILYQDELMLVIEDIEPRAKVHCLVIPREHYARLRDMNLEQITKLGQIISRIPSIADTLGLVNGYRLIVNQGEDAGQTVFHLHIHMVGGEKLGFNPG